MKEVCICTGLILRRMIQDNASYSIGLSSISETSISTNRCNFSLPLLLFGEVRKGHLQHGQAYPS
jgi:hypothetical protein